MNHWYLACLAEQSPSPTPITVLQTSNASTKFLWVEARKWCTLNVITNTKWDAWFHKRRQPVNAPRPEHIIPVMASTIILRRTSRSTETSRCYGEANQTTTKVMNIFIYQEGHHKKNFNCPEGNSVGWALVSYCTLRFISNILIRQKVIIVLSYGLTA